MVNNNVKRDTGIDGYYFHCRLLPALAGKASIASNRKVHHSYSNLLKCYTLVEKQNLLDFIGNIIAHVHKYIPNNKVQINILDKRFESIENITQDKFPFDIEVSKQF